MKKKLPLICVFLSGICFTNAQLSNCLSNSTKADSLYQQGKYWDASIFYERCLFELANDSVTEKSEVNNILRTSLYLKAVKSKISCLKLEGNLRDLPDFITRCRQLDIPDSFRQTLGYDEMLAYYLNGNYTLAIEAAKSLDSTLFSKEEIKVGKLITILSLNELCRWNDAAKCYGDYLKENSDKIRDIGNAEILFKKSPKLNSERKARMLSIFLPGLGQAYAGRTLEGLGNLLLQTSSVLYILASWESGYYLASVLIGGSLFEALRSGCERRAAKLISLENNKKIVDYKQLVRKEVMLAFK